MQCNAILHKMPLVNSTLVRLAVLVFGDIFSERCWFDYMVT